jgi:hypothetical protein
MRRTKIRSSPQSGKPPGLQELDPNGWAQVVRAIRELSGSKAA